MSRRSARRSWATRRGTWSRLRRRAVPRSSRSWTSKPPRRTVRSSVRAVHGAGSPGRRPRARRGAGARAQLHRHRAHPARAAAYERGPCGARALESLEVTVEEVRAQVALIVGQGDEVTAGQIPFTPRAKKVLDLALREALSLGHDYIGPEHILLGLVRENQGLAARILLDLGADAEKVRDEIIRMLSGSGSGPARGRTTMAPPPPKGDGESSTRQGRRALGLLVAFALGVLTGRARRAH